MHFQNAQNVYLGATSKTLPTGVKLLLQCGLGIAKTML